MAEYTFPNARTWLSGDFTGAGFKKDETFLRKASIHEGLSQLTETEVLVFSKADDVDLGKLVGQRTNIHMEDENKKQRMFTGICVSAEAAGFWNGWHNYILEIRPWFWVFTRRQNNRVFQDKTTVEIIEDVLRDGGFSDFDTKKLTYKNYKKRNYCVQYRETDYDFLCRLMEEEGIYFFFQYATDATTAEKLVLGDASSAHSAIPGHAEIVFRNEGEYFAGEEHAENWMRMEKLTSGKVSLTDFDFMKPDANMLRDFDNPHKTHAHAKSEVYDYPAHHRIENDYEGSKMQGDQFAKVRLQSLAVEREVYMGDSNIRALAAGHTFALKGHETASFNKKYLVVTATHFVQEDNIVRDGSKVTDTTALRRDFPSRMSDDAYGCMLSAIPSDIEFRAPQVTKWPEISGLHTATVVGKKGEEIWTDAQGRIKVQFHWDRKGKQDENSSCWVRVVTPWSGNGYGMVALPRMGQEVVIQFEEGNPDRPICTGMLYNEPKKPAYEFPAHQTQLGIRTKSSKKGKENEYNELMFDDLKGSELMRIQAQKDHQELIKNKSAVTIGLDKHELVDAEGKIKADVKDGSLSEVIKQNVTRVIKEGDHDFSIKKGDETVKIETGSQTLEIKKDKTQTIEGKHTKTITGNDATTVKTGNMTTTVKTGNMSVDVSAGKITMTAAQKIELKVGGSTVTIDPVSVTIKTTMLKFEAKAMAEVKAAMTTVKGDAMLTLKGGLTMIN
ncbi:type VI secretion system tip protein TssI/VgrG [Sedimentitalea sp. JM2-8]|uniref:Type VI secretion system tip protein TssI/VgrG n=1 Tax=Sedimentitalea xiamensis TaxID=3050037 RepID=A0ABT7FI42_9RHOB|nr:type VI secretion system tip protein TssI/VgrG [Sedimentitalea xiamensis]MDK3074809.1 type VI secretion system tip protein TssI/VgrG [Sedimentitalea xiamensis]